MTKVKINSGLMALMITASLFVGWQTLLLVTVLLFAFFEVEDSVKNVAIKVITFYIALAIVSAGWGLIVDGIKLVFSSINNVVLTIDSYLEEPIDISKLQLYVFTPITNIVKIADEIISYLFILVKLGFVISVLTGKKQKDNVITNKINDFVNKALSFINNFNAPVMAQASEPVQTPVVEQPVQSVQPSTPVQTPTTNVAEQTTTTSNQDNSVNPE